MSSIYELTADFLRIQEMMEDPELDPQTLADTMEAVEGELEMKAEAYAKVMKNIESDAEGLENEIRRLLAVSGTTLPLKKIAGVVKENVLEDEGTAWTMEALEEGKDE